GTTSWARCSRERGGASRRPSDGRGESGERGGASRRPSDGRGESGERGGASRRPSDGRGESGERGGASRRRRRGEPMIKVERLVKAFGRQQVLRGLDLDVATGSITVVIGRSGGGKSVLLRHLIGLLRPDAGRVLVDGADVTRLHGRALDDVRRRYGVVFQGGALFDSMTCAGNVAFPLREKLRLRAAEVATRVEAALTQVGPEGMGI